ncbi:hypothetical protein VNO77_42306 [Canavalia gladiata]|uniref:Protein TIFY n=1 Tax=Canavalia gladiata TaxID=3824 RepID=A0AAN9K2F7_CANGL
MFVKFQHGRIILSMVVLDDEHGYANLEFDRVSLEHGLQHIKFFDMVVPTLNEGKRLLGRNCGFLQCFALKMERDFLGLSSKESLHVVKEEMNNGNGCKDSGYMNGAVVKWPFLNKVSVHPHLMSFSASQDDKAKMMVSDSITSSGFSAIPTFDTIQKCAVGEPQKSFNHDGQGGIHFSLTPYPVLHNVNSVNRSHGVKMFSGSMGHPSLKNHFATVGQNMNDANVKQPLLGGIPITAPHSAIPIVGAVAGMTETCVKPSGPAPQLTIFYAGTVNVFDDISPEKAQAIMLLAGNGLYAAPNMAQLKVQAPNSKLAAGEGVPVSLPINIPSCSGLSSALSVSSHTGAQSVSGSSGNDEFLASKSSGGPTAGVSKVETPKVVNATSMLPSAVPQARKASLARFLEKRKERVMNATPYNFNKKSENVPHQNSMVSNITASVGTDALLTKQG